MENLQTTKPKVSVSLDISSTSFLAIPNDLFYSKNLNSHDKTLISYILSFNRDKKLCYASLKTFENILGVSKSSVIIRLKKLENLSLIHIEKNQGSSSTYHVNYKNLLLFLEENKFYKKTSYTPKHIQKNTSSTDKKTPPCFQNNTTTSLNLTPNKNINKNNYKKTPIKQKNNIFTKSNIINKNTNYFTQKRDEGFILENFFKNSSLSRILTSLAGRTDTNIPILKDFMLQQNWDENTFLFFAKRCNIKGYTKVNDFLSQIEKFQEQELTQKRFLEKKQNEKTEKNELLKNQKDLFLEKYKSDKNFKFKTNKYIIHIYDLKLKYAFAQKKQLEFLISRETKKSPIFQNMKKELNEKIFVLQKNSQSFTLENIENLLDEEIYSQKQNESKRCYLLELIDF